MNTVMRALVHIYRDSSSRHCIAGCTHLWHYQELPTAFCSNPTQTGILTQPKQSPRFDPTTTTKKKKK